MKKIKASWLKGLEGRTAAKARQVAEKAGLAVREYDAKAVDGIPALAHINTVRLWVRDGIVETAVAGDPCQVTND